MEEFARHGIAGARVERIAAAAGSNKAQIYHYYGSKDLLFDAVFCAIIEDIVRDIPIDATDLPKYAARLAAGYQSNPHIMRLSTWQRLERGNDAPFAIAIRSMGAKTAAVAAAQREGIVSDHLPPDVMLGVVLHMAQYWTSVTPEYTKIAQPVDPEEQLAYVAECVRRIVTPGG